MPRILNQRQKEAVEYKEAPLLIIAGAGTGKTTVITERIRHIIKENLAKPEEILALTFTERAAKEMEDRTDNILPYGYTQMWISTFHGFCDQVLRQEAISMGLTPSFKLMTESESISFLKKNLSHLITSMQTSPRTCGPLGNEGRCPYLHRRLLAEVGTMLWPAPNLPSSTSDCYPL